MGNKKDLLDKARKLIIQDLITYIHTEIYYPEGGYAKFQFTNGNILYITYNDHSEYSYQYLYSMKTFDRERFDNYDKEWNVPTKPHHFHPRNDKGAIESNMTGVPEQDMPLLIGFIMKRL